MSGDSRKEILRRIKTGLRGPSNTIEEKETIFPPPTDGKWIQQRITEVRERLEEKKWDLINRFIDEITKAGGRVMVGRGEDEIRGFITRLIEEYNAKLLAMWESDLLIGLRNLILDKSLQLASPINKDEMARADIGITGTDFAIAETGTIVLITNETQPRSISLIPPIHIAVMRSNVVVENLDELFFLVKNRSEPTSCMTFITGPSRTADIELNLTLGVHGPKELIVLIYP